MKTDLKKFRRNRLVSRKRMSEDQGRAEPALALIGIFTSGSHAIATPPRPEGRVAASLGVKPEELA